MAVTVNNTASIRRLCRIFWIVELPESIRTVIDHAAPVIFHIIHCLVFFAAHQKCFYIMMVHVWRDHSFFRFQLIQLIKHCSAFFNADCTCKDQPYLTCVVDLFFFATYKQACFLIQKIFSDCCSLFFCFFFKLFCFFCISEDFCNLLYFFCTVDVNTLHSSLFVQSVSPVDESPESFAIFHQMFFIKLLSCDLHLTVSAFT